MLANNSGFPITQERDEFGHRFSGPGLNQRSISIRWAGKDTLAMRVPSSVSLEMRTDAESGAHYSVDDAGLVVFGASGPHADNAIRRAAALIRALPDTPLTTYWEKTRTMPASTEAERLVKQRIGQDIFRASLEDYWGGRCPITGITDRVLLRASHTKPWADCGTDEERLDVYNGFLLAAHVDAAFDAALMTIDQDGALLWSSKLSEKAKAVLKDSGAGQIRIAPPHQIYLAHHRERFRVQEAI
jgi:HNH endonuclease